jgi:hypothetical protein
MTAYTSNPQRLAESEAEDTLQCANVCSVIKGCKVAHWCQLSSGHIGEHLHMCAVMGPFPAVSIKEVSALPAERLPEQQNRYFYGDGDGSGVHRQVHIADLERAVIEAAAVWDKWYRMRMETTPYDDDLHFVVDVLIAVREVK